MAPSGSVPAGGRRSSIERPASNHSGLPASLPRFEGFGSTLGGFARSPQVSRVQTSLSRRENEPGDPADPEFQQTEFVESLQTPFLTSDEQVTADSQKNQSLRPSSLLARSLGAFTDVFPRQVSLFAGTLKTSKSVCCCSYAIQLQKRQEERPYSGTEDVLNGALGGSPTAGWFLVKSLQKVANACAARNTATKGVQCADPHGGGAPSMPGDKDLSDDIVIGPMPHARTPPTGDKQTRAAQIQAAFLCGIINSIITIPVMTSFAAIIFQVSGSHQ